MSAECRAIPAAPKVNVLTHVARTPFSGPRDTKDCRRRTAFKSMRLSTLVCEKNAIAQDVLSGLGMYEYNTLAHLTKNTLHISRWRQVVDSHTQFSDNINSQDARSCFHNITHCFGVSLNNRRDPDAIQKFHVSLIVIASAHLTCRMTMMLLLFVFHSFVISLHANEVCSVLCFDLMRTLAPLFCRLKSRT